MSEVPSISLATAASKNIDFSKCILCQKKSDKTGNSKLSSTIEGRKKIAEASLKFEDSLLTNLTTDEKDSIKYHSTYCYGSYMKKAARVTTRQSETTEYSTECSSEDPTTSTVKTRLSSPLRPVPTNLSKTCIICNKERYRGKHENVYRISEAPRAELFIAAYSYFKDDVYERCIFSKTTGDIYASDIMAHSKCMQHYLLKFKRMLDHLNNLQSQQSDTCPKIDEVLEKFCESLNFESQGYELSRCRDEINCHLLNEGLEIDNRQLKRFLAARFGEEICFTYPKDRSKSEMFFSTKLSSTDLAEKIRYVDIVKDSAKTLREECKEYNFGLEKSYCDSNDINISLDRFTGNRPQKWEHFFQAMLDKQVLGDDDRRVCDSIFQMVHGLITRRFTPLGIGFAQTIHDTCRSKRLITMGNRLGVCAGYATVERIDTALAKRLIEQAGVNNVPIPPCISDGIIHAASDNFDKLDGKEGSHDTILMLFQNGKFSESMQSVSSMASMSDKRRCKKLHATLECQNLLKSGRTAKTRGSIPSTFVVTEPFPSECQKSSNHFLWILVRYFLSLNKSDQSLQIPSFSAMNSILSDEDIILTRIGFTPILPYPATDFDSIFTAMKNYQNILHQKKQPYGPFWCDEGVYRIAKELQFLKPKEFSNLFIGLGGFHMEKVVLACIGQYLEVIGARDIFIQNEIFKSSTVDGGVMTGGNYVQSRRGMQLLTEAMSRVRLNHFFRSHTLSKAQLDMASDISSSLKGSKLKEVKLKWKSLNDLMYKRRSNFYDEFEQWVKKSSEESERCKYWSLFLDTIMPIINDLTSSFRNGNWDMHLSAVRRALPLFFAFGRTNYCRWTPVYFEECKNLPQSFPALHDAFKKGDFVVHHSKRKGSGVPIDQALEKAYNKPAKDPGGIIGFTRRKESVAKWNLIRHEKSGFTKFIEDFCDSGDRGQYTLHHEFSPTVTEENESKVAVLFEFLIKRDEIFNKDKLANLVTGTEIDEEIKKYLLHFNEQGEVMYTQYQKDRLLDKKVPLFEKITKPSLQRNDSKSQPTVDLKKEQLKLTRMVDVARTRGYDLKKLFQYEITSTSLFMTHTNGTLRTPDSKSNLLKEIRVLSSLKEAPLNETSAVIIDFMAHSRKLGGKNNKQNIRTFGDWMEWLWKSFLDLCGPATRIDVVFDLYLRNSRKSGERKNRSSTYGIRTSINHLEQPLPAELQKFWACNDNKIALQQFFIAWICNNYHGDKYVFLGGCHEKGELYECYMLHNGVKRKVRLLHCTHEEADDRMQYHISHAVDIDRIRQVLVSSADTDVFCSLMYNFPRWKGKGLELLWVEHNKKLSSIHQSVEHISSTVLQMLPAIHALTGCDATSKVATKKSAFLVAQKDEHAALQTFGTDDFGDGMMIVAERFLVDCMPKVQSQGAASFDEIRHIDYHRAKLIDLEKFPCTSKTLRHHIKRAYLQSYIWIHASTVEDIMLDETLFGYTSEEDGSLVPIIVDDELIPSDFPMPCTCLKCARSNVCPCRVDEIPCCDFCKCKGVCKNPCNA